VSKWTEYKKELESRFQKVFSCLNPPASKNDIQKLEKRIGEKLPREFYEIYNECDGEKRESLGVVYGMRMLPIHDILEEMDGWDEIINEGLDDNDECTSMPKNTINCVYADSKWVPLFSDGSGNFIGLDFNPDSKGKKGQIINFGRDEEAKRVLSKTLASFFTLITALSKKDYFKTEDDGSFSLGGIFIIDALKLPNLDKTIAQRNPDYGFYSIWVFSEHANDLESDYFTEAFYSDFEINKKSINSTETNMKHNGNVETIESLIKFSQYYNKYEKKLLTNLSELSLEKVGIVHIVNDYNYDKNIQLVESKGNIIYVGCYKVY